MNISVVELNTKRVLVEQIASLLSKIVIVSYHSLIGYLLQIICESITSPTAFCKKYQEVLNNFPILLGKISQAILS